MEKTDSFLGSIHWFVPILEMSWSLHILKIICLELEDLIKNLGGGMPQEKWAVGQVSAHELHHDV